MGTLKLSLDDIDMVPFELVAIHCSLPAHRLGYKLNGALNFGLTRREKGLSFNYPQGETEYACFDFIKDYSTAYFLLENKKVIQVIQKNNAAGLFGEETSTSTYKFNLLPEYGNADFLLKIETEIDPFPMRVLLDQLNKVPQIISAYAVDQASINAIENLTID